MDGDINKVRTENFLRILREKYGNSPARLERETGYSANMTSQISTGRKKVHDKLARTLERVHLKVPLGTLDRADGTAPMPKQAATPWPFSISRSEYEALSPRVQQEIDDWLTRMVIGAQAQQVISKTRKRTG